MIMLPRQDYGPNIPDRAYRMPMESNQEFRQAKKEFRKAVSLSKDKNKFCTDPTYVTLGRAFSYISKKYLKNADSFEGAFNIRTGTGVPELKESSTPAQKFWRKRVSVGGVTIEPWHGRECQSKSHGNHVTCAAKPIHVVMDRVPNPEGRLLVDEILPVGGRKRKREAEVESPRKKKVVNAWIAYRSYHQSLFKAMHHQSEISGKIKTMYETVSNEDKAKWCDVAREYTKGRDSFPGASRAWLSGMMATIVSNAGLAQQQTDIKTEIPAPPLVELPSKLSLASVHTPQNVAESRKRARENGEPEFGRIPKKARLIIEEKRKRLREAEPEPVQEERSVKKVRVLKGDTSSEDLGFDIARYSEHFGIRPEPEDSESSRDTTPDSFADTNTEDAAETTLDTSLEDVLVSVPDIIPKDTPEFIPNDVSETILEAADFILESTLDITLEAVPDIVLEATNTALEPPTDFILESITDDILEITPDDIREVTPDDILENTSDIILKSTSDIILKSTSDMILEITPEIIIEKAPDVIVRDTPDLILETISDTVLESSPEIIVEITPDVIVGDNPDAISKTPSDNSPDTSLDVESDTESDISDRDTFGTPQATPDISPDTSLEISSNNEFLTIMNILNRPKAAPDDSVGDSPGDPPGNSPENSPENHLDISSNNEANITPAISDVVIDLFTLPKDISENFIDDSLDVVSDGDAISIDDLFATPDVEEEEELAPVTPISYSNDPDDPDSDSRVFSSFEKSFETETSFGSDTSFQNPNFVDRKKIPSESEDDHEPQESPDFFEISDNPNEIPYFMRPGYGAIGGPLPTPLPPELGSTSTQPALASSSNAIEDIRNCFSSIEDLMLRYQQPSTISHGEHTFEEDSEIYDSSETYESSEADNYKEKQD
ncbi:hypothetical protein TWF102_003370 [Orbilia oligospora]|uniref:Alpha box domain-containing protein n=1 Tax=Orbilia oligospora TaxID=2813651 RepID=A0A7C8NS02_ORBOL|nr:hypothetical protein TWF102_003370 [Orbilia oligospora]